MDDCLEQCSASIHIVRRVECGGARRPISSNESLARAATFSRSRLVHDDPHVFDRIQPRAPLQPSTAGSNRLTPMSTVQTDLVEAANVIPMRDENQVSREDVFGHDHELIIEPGRAERHYWRDLWQYRELFQVLAWRDISVRYKQTVIGAAWALIRPFLTMVVFTVVFGKLAKLPSDGTAPYALDGVCRDAALEFLRHRSGRCLE